MPSVQRDTAQRRAIRQVVQEAGRPLSPGEVLQLAQGIIPAMGIATVYRSVKALLAEQWLVAVEVPGEPQRYEVAGKGHHHHFTCRACGRMFDFDGCPGSLRQLVPEGFTLDAHEIFLFGSCADCRGAGPRA